MNKRPEILVTTVPVEVIINQDGLNGHPHNRIDTFQSWTQAVDEKYQLKIDCPPVGLRFLKENVPGVEILEYPTWKQYEAALARKWDLLGISFFTCGADAVPLMVQMARTAGVKELWAGNYGVSTPGINRLFDRTITGAGEKVLYELVTGKTLESIKHPVLISNLQFRSFTSKVGYLYTKRGCNMGCSFCPTPQFLPQEDPISMEEIIKVLDIYEKENVANVVIYDETFMTDMNLSLRTAEALAERSLPWLCLTRADRIKNRIDQFADLYMDGAILGIESVREANLQSVQKREKARDIETIINAMVKRGLRTIGTYMIGYPEDTAESVRKDIERVAALGLFVAQVSILTPFPGTPLWDELAGKITDKVWDHYDIHHLVWNHPHIKPDEMRDLLAYAQEKINNPIEYMKKLRGMFHRQKEKQRPAATASTL